MDFQFLIEMAWKSAAISAAALALAALLRSRSAGERSALLGTAAALIVALPLISLLLPSLPIVTGTVHETAPATLTARELASLAASAPTAASGGVDDPVPLLELLWAGGALMVLMRLAAGLWTLRRWTLGGSDVACPAWREALARAKGRTGCRREVRLLVSDAPSPLSWGSLHPVILLDRDTVRDPGEADAVLAHELAHVVRGDWLVLILARLALALFWFNPLMWLLERRIAGEAEEAADARAIEHVDAPRYAQTLLSCAQQQQAALRLPASGMADAGLGRRVRAILERRLRSGAPDPRRIRAAVLVVTLIAAPIAALKPVVAVIRSEAPPAPPAPSKAPPPAPRAPHAPAPPAAPEVMAVLAAAGVAPPPPAAPAAVPAPPAMPYGVSAPPAPPAPPAAPARLRPLVDGDEIARDVAEAVAEAMADKDEALRDAAEAREEALREARGEAVQESRRAAAEAARRGLAAGAHGIEAGARGMEQGAEHLEREAGRLRSSDYREQQIARAAREGKTLTHQQLLDMIPRLQDGARGMRDGAARMRRDAEKMRRQG